MTDSKTNQENVQVVVVVVDVVKLEQMLPSSKMNQMFKYFF
jgi:hypothetical protein